MKSAAFQYFRPETVEDALGALAEDGDARPIAGGQSLLALMNLRLARPTGLVDLARLPLGFIEEEANAIRIGALVTHGELAGSELIGRRLPLLAAAARHVGHPAIRTRGTLGGSLSHADPAAEELAAAMVLGAELEVRSPRGTRTVAAAELATGPWTTVLDADELVLAARFGSTGSAWGFSEFAPRSGDFALAGACVAFSGGELRVAVFGAAPTPRLLTFAEADPERAGRRAAEEVDLASDEDGDWRRALVTHEVRSAVASAMGRLA